MLNQRSILFFIFTLLSIQLCLAQTNGKIVNGHAGGVSLASFPPKKANAEGSTYIEDEWRLGRILLKDGSTIADVPLKYDIKNGLMEIKTETEIKVLEKARIEKFKWINNLLVFVQFNY